jgi:hypothetical protein
VSLRVAAQPPRLETVLGRPILPANQPLVEVQVYTASHLKSMSLVGHCPATATETSPLQGNPGLWIPALLYDPEKVARRVPVILNTNGHERTGVADDYIYIRCMDEAKKGGFALNFDVSGGFSSKWY